MDYTLVLIDNPAPHVRRVTLNRLTQNVTQAGTATPAADYPYIGAGGFQRSVVDLWTSMWDLSKPVIAQDGRTITAHSQD